jgi:DNA-binding response OmpR family regulator
VGEKMFNQPIELIKEVPTETILILEKESHIQWTVKTLLENEKYIVVAVNSIDRALQNFSEFQVSGFITEYRIDQRSTLEMIRSLKNDFPDTYVMMITDNEVKEDEYEEIMAAGVDDYFLKPIPVAKILLHLRKGLKQRGIYLEKKKMEDELARMTKGSKVETPSQNGNPVGS